ncbi:MAG: hypothetical protein R3Y47_09990 [Lachnospiraceae bacterium]
MIYTIGNKNVTMQVASRGAEVQSVRTAEQEYTWCGDPAHWPKRAPLLFPIVGRTENGYVKIEGEKYEMDTHGFLSSMEFALVSQSEERLVLVASFDTLTLKQYPYKFEVQATYEVLEQGYQMSYEIRNLDDRTMAYGFGLHPSFMCYREEQDRIEDFYVTFDETFSMHKPYRMPSALVDFSRRIPIMDNSNRIDLKQEYFHLDALIMDHINYHQVELHHKERGLVVSCDIEGFDWFNIWRFEDSPFVCLEPWCSMHGTHPFAENIEDHESTKYLEKGEKKNCQMKIRLGDL